MARVDIGKKLRDTRVQQKMSLDELQQITKIQKRYLLAIEENDFDSMPGTFYVRAFIKQYASAVGLDGNELVNIYDNKDEPEAIEKVIEYETLEKSRTQMYDEDIQKKQFMRSLPAIIFSLVGLAIVVVVLYITWQDRKSNPIIKTPVSQVIRETTTATTSSQTTEKSSSTTETATTSSTVESPKAKVTFEGESGTTVTMSATDITAPAKIDLSATTGACWVGIYIATTTNSNNGYYYQQTIQPGSPQSVEIPEGTKQLVISLGASEYIDMKLGGQSIVFNPNHSGIGPRTINLSVAYTAQ